MIKLLRLAVLALARLVRRPLRLAILASGSGTTALAVLLACRKGGVLYGLVEIVCLIVSKRDAGVIEKFKNAGFTGRIAVCDPRDFPDRKAFGRALVAILEEVGVDWYGQYGWLPKTPEEVIARWPGINQHPASPKHFGGKGMFGTAPHAAVLWFKMISKRTIQHSVVVAQLVAPNYDEGALIYCLQVPLVPADILTGIQAKELQRRALPIEHACQIAALLRIAAFGGDPSRLPPVEDPFEVLPDEAGLLAEAKRRAINTYPHG